MTLLEAYKKVVDDIWNTSGVDGGDEVVQISCTFFVIAVIMIAIIGTVVVWPHSLAVVLIFALMSGFGIVVLYGPCAIIYRTIRTYFRHDNPDEDKPNVKGLGS